MEAATVEQRVVKVVSEVLKVPAADIARETKIVDELGADSLDVATLGLALEEEFNASLPDDQDSALTTVGAIVDAITARMATSAQ